MTFFFPYPAERVLLRGGTKKPEKPGQTPNRAQDFGQMSCHFITGTAIFLSVEVTSELQTCSV